MRQQHVTQRQNKQIMEGNEWETERFPIRQETHTQRHAIPANFSYFIAFPTLRSNRRRQRERAHTLHIDVGTTTLSGSSLRVCCPLHNHSKQQHRQGKNNIVVVGTLWFMVFFFFFWKKPPKFAFLLSYENQGIYKTPESPESSSSDSDASVLPDAPRH